MILATVSAVAVAVILLGFPLAFLGAQLVKDNELRELQIRATNIARAVEGRLGREDPVTADVLEPYVGGEGRLGAYIEVVLPTGERVTAGDVVEGRRQMVGALGSRGKTSEMRRTISAEGTTASRFQPLVFPTSMNSMKRRI